MSQELLSRKLPYHYLKKDGQVIAAILKGIRPVYVPKPIDGRDIYEIESLLGDICKRSWTLPATRRIDAKGVLKKLQPPLQLPGSGDNASRSASHANMSSGNSQAGVEEELYFIEALTRKNASAPCFLP